MKFHDKGNQIYEKLESLLKVVKLRTKMITHELAKIWITSDGRRFIDKQKAIIHEKKIERIEEKIYERWLCDSHK